MIARGMRQIRQGRAKPSTGNSESYAKLNERRANRLMRTMRLAVCHSPFRAEGEKYFIESERLNTAAWKYLNFKADFLGGAYDFLQNYMHMRKANTKGADKYFHCMANCKASRRRFGGGMAAILLSESRELYGEYIKGDPSADSSEDRAANRLGRRGNPNQSCREVCRKLRPSGLDPKY